MKYTKKRIAELRKSWKPNKGYPVRGDTLLSLLDEIENLDLFLETTARENGELHKIILRLQAENGWIPVSERLPEDNTVVIAVSKFGNGQHVFPSWFKDGLFHYQAEMIYECETPVTHWRPLPQPPED